MLKNLNKAQQEAVTYTNGALLIVAGAGTGKTTVITQKISYLIKEGLAQPEEILALTFTEKAAQEMQDRVDEIIDSSYSELSISTFHAFSQELIGRYGLAIGVPNRSRLLTQTEAWMLMREHIYDFNLDYYRPLGNPARHIHALLQHFSKCKDELISPADYLTYAENVKLDKDDVQTDEKSRLAELANAYHEYNQLLLKEGALDFGDLIYYSVDLLQKRPAIKDLLQKQYKYILVDEFQDVNWAQYKLIQLLAEHSQLTVVGDDDQSIYAFRGASVSNIMRFNDDYKNVHQVVLTKNYRSGQEILDIAYRSIQNNNPDRLEPILKINKKLLAAGGITKAKVKHIHEATLDEEVSEVVSTITSLKQSDTDLGWDDFAILVRANNHAAPYIHALGQAGIPYEFLASQGLFRQPIVLDCMSFFRAIESVYDSAAIYRLLNLPFSEINQYDFRKLTAGSRRKSIPYYYAFDRVDEFKFSEEGKKQTQALKSMIDDGAKQARLEKPTVVLYQFLETSGYLSYLTQEEDQGNREVIRQIYQLKQFFEQMAAYEQARPEARVHDYLEYYNYLLDSGDQGQLYQPTDTPDSLNILTVHASKGLEYKYVFVVNMVDDRFPSKRRGGDIPLPNELIHEVLPEGDHHYQEERRLFYVAATRAKQGLYFASGDNYGGKRKKKISRFLAELDFVAPTVTCIAQPSAHLQKVEQVEPGEFLAEIPKAFSFSQLKTYQTCPYKYKLQHILKIPTKGSAAFSFGSSMHNTMQTFYEKMQELNSVQQASLFDLAPIVNDNNSDEIKVPSLDELYTMYDDHWISDWYTSKRQREDYYKKGKDILRVFYGSQKGKWHVPVSLEGGFKIKVGDYWLRGRIDRIDKLEDGSLEIIDYKTGKSKEKVIGEDKEQLLIYQIAAETLPKYYNEGKVSKLTFYYLNDQIRTSFFGKDKELEKLQEKLVGTIEDIHKRDFMATPGKFACSYCDFKDICQFRG